MTDFKLPPTLEGVGRQPALCLDLHSECLLCRPAGSQRREAAALDNSLLIGAVLRSFDRGVSSVLLGGGDPVLHRSFRDILLFVHALDVVPVVFTPALMISQEVARFIERAGASVVFSFDSFSPRIQDRLAGRPGAAYLMRQSLRWLLNQDFSSNEPDCSVRLAAVIRLTKSNLREIEEIWSFCRENRIFPVACLPRAHPDCLSPEEVQDCTNRLKAVDLTKYGIRGAKNVIIMRDAPDVCDPVFPCLLSSCLN